MDRLWFNANSEKQVIDFDNESNSIGQSAPHRPMTILPPPAVRAKGGEIRAPIQPRPRTNSMQRTETPSPQQRANRMRLQNYVQQYGTPETPLAKKKLKTIVSVPLCCLWSWGCCKEATFING